MIRVVLAEDQAMVRGALTALLKLEPDIDVVATAADGEEAWRVLQQAKPDLLVTDIGLPGLNGFAVVRTLREERRPVAVVFLTVHDDEAMFEAALELDVRGYLLKDCTDSEVARCISAVAAGHHYTSPSMTTYLVNKTHRIERFEQQTAGLHLLTPQERAILGKIARDKTSKEIAEEMGIARKTVDAHRSSICRKLDIHGQHVLARFAARHRAEL